MRITSLVFISLMICLCTSLVQADELQITDYLGLIRAQKEIEQKCDLEITVLRNEKLPLDIGYGNPLLVQRSGIAANIEAEDLGSGKFIFHDVTPGIWRIRLRNQGLLLDRVEIVNHAH